MKRLLLGLVLLLSVGAAKAQTVANWTIMHYGAVDNDLEGAAFNDYYEMQLTGSGDGVNIVAQFDRAEGYDNRFGDWTDTRRFLIEQGEATPELDSDAKRQALLEFFVAAGIGDEALLAAEIANLDNATVEQIYGSQNLDARFDQTPIEELGEVDMGDPESLFDFIIWAANTYPAEHYLLVIGSHGAGWRGIGPDYGNDGSMLEVYEIAQALEAAQAQLGVDSFDIVGFDACLMAVADVAVSLSPYADYVLFSEEVIPSNGWEYTNSINDMKANPDWDAFQVGAAFVDNYMNYYAGVGARTKLGLSLVETAGVGDLLASLQNFADVIGTDTVALLSALGTARNNSQIFGASLGDRADYYSYVDLRDFMTWFSLQTTITEDAYNAAQEVIAAYDRTVVYSLADAKLPRATGLAIYLPPTSTNYAELGVTYPDLAPRDFYFWQDYLAQFFGTIATELDGSSLVLDINNLFTLSGIGSMLDNPTVFFDAGGVGVVDMSYRVTFIEANGTGTIVDLAPISYTTTLPTGETVVEYPYEVTPSSFTWSAQVPLISDGTNSVIGLMQASAATGSEATIWGTYVSQAGQQPAFIVVDQTTLTVQGILAIADDAPYEVRPTPGDQFIVDLFVVGSDGVVSVQPQTDAPLTFDVEPFRISYVPAISGEYSLALNLYDLAGNGITRDTPITVNNDAVDGSLRGYTDTNEGIYFQYIAAWGDSYSETADDGAITNILSDTEGLNALYIDTYVDSDPLTVVQDALAAAESPDSPISDATLGGLPAYYAEYFVPMEDGTLSTVVLLGLANEAAGTTVLFATVAESDEAASNILSRIDASLQFFEPVS